jgi:hypothetical protein
MQPDSDRHIGLSCRCGNGQGEIGRRGGMVVQRTRRSGDREVAISRRLDLFDSEAAIGFSPPRKRGMTARGNTLSSKA